MERAIVVLYSTLTSAGFKDWFDAKQFGWREYETVPYDPAEEFNNKVLR